jgi:hypothetical protein
MRLIPSSALRCVVTALGLVLVLVTSLLALKGSAGDVKR